MTEATEKLAKIVISSNILRGRRRRYEEILSLIPFIDVHAKVITVEDEYVINGENSNRWNLPGEFTIFETFIKYEYIPVMCNLLENITARKSVQQILYKFLEHGAIFSRKIDDIVEALEDAKVLLPETQIALNLITDITNKIDNVKICR